MPTNTQRSVMLEAGFRVTCFGPFRYYWSYAPAKVRGIGSHRTADKAWESAWQYVLGGHSIAEVESADGRSKIGTLTSAADGVPSKQNAIPSKEEAIDFAMEAMRKIKLSELAVAGYTVQRAPTTLGYAVYFDSYRIDSIVHNSDRQAWDWACLYLTKDPKGGKVLVLRRRGFTIHHNEKDGLWWINHDNEPAATKGFSDEQEAWEKAINIFWKLPDAMVGDCKRSVRMVLEARAKDLSIKPMSSADLAKSMGFDTEAITKVLDSVGKWLVNDKPLRREELAERKIYIMHSKESGHAYWWDMNRNIESSRGWETEQEAVDAANEWLFNHHVINRSDLK